MTFSYIGSELDLFSTAKCWKGYLRRRIGPFIGKNVLEVGAGLGETTKFLCDGSQESWVCLEPDVQLTNRIADAIRREALPKCCQPIVGTLATSNDLPKFDTVLYIDVLEHIEYDRAEIVLATDRLVQGGYLIVLSPAHQWLFTPFDQSIGHYRRYSKSSLSAVANHRLQLVQLVYLDSVGMIASIGNRFVLNSAMPTRRQIAIWDRVMVRMSRFADPLLGYRLGKSILAIWRRV